MINQTKKEENARKKAYLKKYRKSYAAVKRIELQIEELRSEKMYPGFQISDMPRSSDKKDLSNYAAALDELIIKMTKARYNRIRVYSEIFRKIENMEDEQERSVLTLRYIKGYEWEKIACEMEYSWPHIHRIHDKALENFKI